MEAAAYLDRIGFRDTPRTDPETLSRLQIAHLQAVPFENLDIGAQIPIRLDEGSLWDKIVTRRRGGFCYELNGLFSWLLKQVGFRVTYLNARVFNRAGGLGIDFDHLALLVDTPGQASRRLTDVGFGDSFLEPLRFETGAEQVQGSRAYRLEAAQAGYVVWQKESDGHWERLYFFDLEPRRFPSDYESACRYHQTSSESHFTKGNVISLATPKGRITLNDNKLIITEDGLRHERPVRDRAEFTQLLQENFDIIL